ncbi:MAG: alpha/beta hydrolase [Fibromonadaceae bacterium]|jgi:pimeloyl-ACP methyl ester carboxylesterase|nr:alpha/beta hydrolase [Fibromonadaceae bacterium]
MKGFAKITMKIFIITISLILILVIINALLLKMESKKILPNGILSEINGHRLHIYAEGHANNKPILVFMSGGATPAPVYDFKPLYSLFTDEYRIVVIERFGYGYSDIVNTKRDIEMILEETRRALQSVGENGTFILFPHSVSGLEALYWLSKYPEEIAAIIGLDMGFPEYYIQRKTPPLNIDRILMKFISMLGIQRFYYPTQVSSSYLSDDEYKQAKYLTYRNFMNTSVLNELKNIYSNAETVQNQNYLNITNNILLFSSDGKERGDFWIRSKSEFAKKMKAQLVILDCNHYVHHFESQKIMEKSKQFLNKILQ